MSCRNWRLDRLLFLRRRWLCFCFSRRSFRLPVILKRLAVDLCVFIFGTVILLPNLTMAH